MPEKGKLVLGRCPLSWIHSVGGGLLLTDSVLRMGKDWEVGPLGKLEALVLTA